MSRTFMITGANGFVGKQVLKALSAQGILCRIVLRKGRSHQFDNNLNIEKIIETDDLFAESVDWWQQLCHGIDTVIHIAWYVEPGKYLYSTKNLDCLIGSLNLIRGAANSGVKKIVGIGTCFEYDLNYGVLSTDTPLNPITPYATAKANLFSTLASFSKELNLQYNWCRLFYLFGEGEDERRFVSYIHSKLSKGEEAELTSGYQVRDFLDIEEAGKQIAEVALQHDYSGPVNICSGIPVSLKQLAEKIADRYGRRDLLKFGARPDNLVDPIVVLGKKTTI